MTALEFGDFTLRPSRRELLRGTKPVAIGARAFDLLLLLARNNQRIIGREEITDHVWPDTSVVANNLNVQIANLRRILGAGAIITVPGRGFKFVLEVTSATLPDDALQLPLRPSVVVLPFTSFNNAENRWLAHGFVEEVTTELSRFRDLFVIARNSAQFFGKEPRNLRDISQQLGVQYVVEGSVRISQQRVRVTAHLVDATTGEQIWAEHFESTLGAHFDTQQVIAHAIVTSLVPQLDRAVLDRVRAAVPADLNAYGLAQRAWAVVSEGEMEYDPAQRTEAIATARQALDIDPRSGLAWRTRAWAEWWHAYHGTTTDLSATLQAGLDAADHAIALDGTDHHARRLKGLLSFMNEQPEAGLAELRNAREINPNCAITLAWSGMYETFHGDSTLGVPLVTEAMQLSPRDPSRGAMFMTLGFAHFAQGDYAAAVSAAENAHAEAAQGASPLVLEAIALVGVGDIAAARDRYWKLRSIAPKLAALRLDGKWLSTNAEYRHRAHTFFKIAAGREDVAAADRLRAPPAEVVSA